MKEERREGRRTNVSAAPGMLLVPCAASPFLGLLMVAVVWSTTSTPTSRSHQSHHISGWTAMPASLLENGTSLPSIGFLSGSGGEGGFSLPPGSHPFPSSEPSSLLVDEPLADLWRWGKSLFQSARLTISLVASYIIVDKLISIYLSISARWIHTAVSRGLAGTWLGLGCRDARTLRHGLQSLRANEGKGCGHRFIASAWGEFGLAEGRATRRNPSRHQHREYLPRKHAI